MLLRMWALLLPVLIGCVWAQQEAREPFQAPDRCTLGPDPGTCSEYHVRWFHNPKSGKCYRFLYRGCEGNDNRFMTERLCQQICQGQGASGVSEDSDVMEEADNPLQNTETIQEPLDGGAMESPDQFSEGVDQGEANEIATEEEQQDGDEEEEEQEGVEEREEQNEEHEEESGSQLKVADDSQGEQSGDDAEEGLAEEGGEDILNRYFPPASAGMTSEDQQTLQQVMSQMDVDVMTERRDPGEPQGGQDNSPTAGDPPAEDDNAQRPGGDANDDDDDATDEEEEQMDEESTENSLDDEDTDDDDDDDDEYPENDPLSGTVSAPIRDLMDAEDSSTLQELMSQMDTYVMSGQEAVEDAERRLMRGQGRAEAAGAQAQQPYPTEAVEAVEPLGDGEEIIGNDTENVDEMDDDDDDDDDDDEEDDMDRYLESMKGVLSAHDTQVINELAAQMTVIRLEAREQEQEQQQLELRDPDVENPVEIQNIAMPESENPGVVDPGMDAGPIDEVDEGTEEELEDEEDGEVDDDEEEDLEMFDIDQRYPRLSGLMSEVDKEMVGELVQHWDVLEPETGDHPSMANGPTDSSNMADGAYDEAVPMEGRIQMAEETTTDGNSEDDDEEDDDEFEVDDTLGDIIGDRRFLFSPSEMEDGDRSALSELLGSMNAVAMGERSQGETDPHPHPHQRPHPRFGNRVEGTTIPPYVLALERQFHEDAENRGKLLASEGKEDEDENEGRYVGNQISYGATERGGERFLPPMCTLPPSTGPCRESQTKWHYDVTSGKCQQFAWSGCGGNANRFTTYRKCKRVCRGGSSLPGLLDYVNRMRKPTPDAYHNDKPNMVDVQDARGPLDPESKMADTKPITMLFPFAMATKDRVEVPHPGRQAALEAFKMRTRRVLLRAMLRPPGGVPLPAGGSPLGRLPFPPSGPLPGAQPNVKLLLFPNQRPTLLIQPPIAMLPQPQLHPQTPGGTPPQLMQGEAPRGQPPMMFRAPVAGPLKVGPDRLTPPTSYPTDATRQGFWPASFPALSQFQHQPQPQPQPRPQAQHQPQPQAQYQPQLQVPYQPQQQVPYQPQQQVPYQPQLQVPYEPQPQGPFRPQPQGPYQPQPQGPYQPQPQAQPPYQQQLQKPFTNPQDQPHPQHPPRPQPGHGPHPPLNGRLSSPHSHIHPHPNPIAFTAPQILAPGGARGPMPRPPPAAPRHPEGREDREDHRERERERGGGVSSFTHNQHVMAPSLNKEVTLNSKHKDSRHYNLVNPDNKVTLFQIFVDKKQKSHHDKDWGKDRGRDGGRDGGRDRDRGRDGRRGRDMDRDEHPYPPHSHPHPHPHPHPQELPQQQQQQPGYPRWPLPSHSNPYHSPPHWHAPLSYPRPGPFHPNPNHPRLRLRRPMGMMTPRPLRWWRPRPLTPMGMTPKALPPLPPMAPMLPPYRQARPQHRPQFQPQQSLSRHQDPLVVIRTVEDDPSEPDYTCLLPLSPGRCKSFQMKWFYNQERESCEIFYFGGCGGNSNRFNTLVECQSVCMGGVPPPSNAADESRELPESAEDGAAEQEVIYITSTVFPETEEEQRQAEREAGGLEAPVPAPAAADTLASSSTQDPPSVREEQADPGRETTDHVVQADGAGQEEIKPEAEPEMNVNFTNRTEFIIIVVVMGTVGIAIILLVTISVVHLYRKMKSSKKERVLEAVLNTHLYGDLPNKVNSTLPPQADSLPQP